MGETAHGKAVQLDPIKPTLKAPGSQRLKLKYGNTLSTVAVKLYLRRYNTGLNILPGTLTSRR